MKGTIPLMSKYTSLHVYFMKIEKVQIPLKEPFKTAFAPALFQNVKYLKKIWPYHLSDEDRNLC